MLMKKLELINAIFGGIVKIIKAVKCKSACCKSSCDGQPEPVSRSKVTEL